MRFGVLGSLAVWNSQGQPVDIPETRVRALLADLVVHEGRPVSVDRLVDDLWEDQPPRNPAGALQHKIWQLRRALDLGEPGAKELIVRQPAGYSLRADVAMVDAARFNALVAQAHGTADPASRAAQLRKALQLWRGPAYADFRDSAFTREAINRLDELWLTAVEEHADARLALGEHREMVAELAGLIDRYPLRERLRAIMMRVLYRSGRQSEALAAYRELRDRLADELGIDPGPEISSLHQMILTQSHALDVIAPQMRADNPRTNLPAPLTELIGRDSAVPAVCDLLTAHRLVTLTGPGGVGKTRLAIAAASALVEAFSDGVWLIDMGTVGPTAGERTDSSPVEAVMRVLGIGESATGGRQVALVDRLVAAIRTKEMLLLVDNCEHLVDDVATLLDLLLRHAPRLRILATSQDPLGVEGELRWIVPPLDLPDDAVAASDVAMGYAAVQLFAARAADASPGFAVTSDNESAVVAVCRRLDGLPLALELAATRVPALGVHELAARLDNRFALLSGGGLHRPTRQQTLRSVIDWSWSLLTAAEQAVLRRLAVHTGGCTLAAAEETCAGEGVAAQEVATILAALVQRSLVMTDSAPIRRYRLLESVAAYAIERLEEAGEFVRLRDRHCTYYTELAEAADPQVRGESQRSWLARLDADAANFQLALATAVELDDATRALRIVGGLTWYWFIRGRLAEAHRSLGAALTVDGEATSAVRAKAMAWYAVVRSLMGLAANPAQKGESALALYESTDDAHEKARARWILGYVECDFGDLTTSEHLVKAALETSRDLGDRWSTAACLSSMAKHAAIRGDTAAMRNNGEQSLALFRELGDRWGQVDAMEWLAELAEITGDYDEATRLHTEALHMAQDLGLWPQVADRISWLGRIAMLRGELSRADQLLKSATKLAAEHSYFPGQLFAEIGLGLVARRMGENAVAETRLRQVLAWTRRMDTDNGAALAMILPELGRLAERRGDSDEAEHRYIEALDVAQRLGDERTAARALEGLAAVQAGRGRFADSARLLGAAAGAQDRSGTVLPSAERAEVERIAADVARALGAGRFDTEFKRGGESSAHQMHLYMTRAPGDLRG